MKTYIANDFEFKKVRKVSTLGVYSGTFAPLHTGHLNVLDKAFAHNEVVILLVGGYSGDRGDLNGMPLKERYKALRERFSHNSRILVAMVDENMQEEYSDEKGLSEYGDCLEKIIATYTEPNPDMIINNYVGELDYMPVMEKYFPQYNHIWVDRHDEKESVIISATQIRENPVKYWDYIDIYFKAFFRKVILLVGASSTGKTTQVEMLAKHFGSKFTQETGRVYTEGWRHTIESDINAQDYLYFISSQLIASQDKLWDWSDSPYVFLDTDGLVIQTYLLLGLEDIDKVANEHLIGVSQISVDWTVANVDLILETNNNVEFEIDGSRDGHLADFRDDFSKVLNELIIKNKLEDKRVVLSSDTIDGKFEQAKRLVEELLK